MDRTLILLSFYLGIFTFNCPVKCPWGGSREHVLWLLWWCPRGTRLWLWIVNCEFSRLIVDYLCMNCCIFTKISQIVCLISKHFLVCRYTRSSSRLWKVIWFNCIFWGFLYFYTFITKLLQIVSLVSFSVLESPLILVLPKNSKMAIFDKSFIIIF